MTHVLEQLFTAGHLPIRRLKLAALEVGAGPAPGLSAIRDFYDDLTVWAQRTNQPVDFAPLTHAFAMDKGPAWEALLHDLWERINELRLQSLGYMGSGLYQVQYSDFTDFSAIQEHTRALESSVRIIEDDFDRAGECISRASARQWAQEEGVHVPSAYDLIVMSNFLTDPQAAKRFSKEIRRLASSLTPGGLIVVLGGQARFYEGLWADLGRLLGGAGLTPLKAFDNPIPSRHDSRWAEQIQAQRHRDLEAIRRDGGTLPRSLENTDEPYRIREFSALVWKNQQPAK
ncbi:hypothetical protein AB0H18_47220 [Streptomyces sp. NPDC020766]|uniref:hypothetical protein n=1 Tax=Streptomyces sp. NPDC020766 TaxID=3155011 RepID=UPI0033FB088A